MANAIIVGATSGIGEALARTMITSGYQIGITGRRLDRLNELKSEFGDHCHTAQFDITDAHAAKAAFNELAKQMGSIDIVVVNSGVGSINPEYPLDDELETARVNVVGFTTIANLSYHLFSEQKYGHLVGISSVAAVRGGAAASYNASKAYVSSYLEGLACRLKTQQFGIHITDIRPGFVDTAMAQGDGLFWVASPENAARQILAAIESKKRVAYITRRWRLVSALIKVIPFSLYKKIVAG